MKIKLLYLLLSISLYASCSLPTIPTQDSLSVTTSNNELKIINRSNKTIYLFVFEQKVAELIDWGPHFNKPNVGKNSTTKIPLTNIYDGSNSPVTAGDKIIIYYRDDTNKTRPKIFSKIIQL
jgi:hypothetical protein